jgi:hypothetical protein
MGRLVAAIGVAALGLAIAASGAIAQDSLGQPAADAAVASLRAKDPDRALTCHLSDDFVVCSGARVGACVAESWLLNHDGSACRKQWR